MKAWGSHVTATCSSDAVDRVLELGADIALDYTKYDVMHELQQLHRYILILVQNLKFSYQTAVCVQISNLSTHSDTHCSDGHFSGKPGLARCPLDCQSPLVLI